MSDNHYLKLATVVILVCAKSERFSMRYHVNKKRFFRTVGNLVILDIILVPLVVFSFLVLQLDDLNLFMLIVIIPFFVLCNLASIPLFVMQGSIVVFEEDVVKCLFRKRILTRNRICRRVEHQVK